MVPILKTVLLKEKFRIGLIYCTNGDVGLFFATVLPFKS